MYQQHRPEVSTICRPINNLWDLRTGNAEPNIRPTFDNVRGNDCFKGTECSTRQSQQMFCYAIWFQLLTHRTFCLDLCKSLEDSILTMLIKPQGHLLLKDFTEEDIHTLKTAAAKLLAKPTLTVLDQFLNYKFKICLNTNPNTAANHVMISVKYVKNSQNQGHKHYNMAR
uniref:Uncharacterized protein n=1 Tax=Glossina pallidipes TaxID=7398 RepID=A0A1A9ZW42_GLOPL